MFKCLSHFFNYSISLYGFFLPLGGLASELASVELAQFHQSVSIRAQEVQADLSYQQLAIMAVQENQLHAIPFQFDEANQEGYVYVADMGVPRSGDPDYWDALDELLFQRQDASTERLKPESLAKLTESVEILAEIVVKSAVSNDRYAYLVRSGPGQMFSPSFKDYVRYDADTSFAETDRYTLAARLDKPMELVDLTFEGDPLNPESLMDTLKMWVIGHSVGGVTQMKITNRHFFAKVMEVIDGPVRASVQFKTKISVAKFPVMHLWVLYQFEPSGIRAVSRAETPEWMSMFIYKTSVGLSIDAKDLRGSKIYSRFSNDAALSYIGQVDGRLSANEIALQRKELALQEPWWFVFSSPRQFQVLARMKIPEQYETPIQLIYHDDLSLSIPPERFKGQLPNIGFQVSKIPVAEVYTMVFDLFFDQALEDLEVDAYVQHKLQPVEYEWRWMGSEP